jgi:CHAT domain
MVPVSVVFLQLLTTRLSDLVDLLGDEWPRFRERLLETATTKLTDSRIANAIVKNALPGPAQDLVRQLMQDASAKAGAPFPAGETPNARVDAPAKRRTRGPVRKGGPRKVRPVGTESHAAASALIDKLTGVGGAPNSRGILELRDGGSSGPQVPVDGGNVLIQATGGAVKTVGDDPSATSEPAAQMSDRREITVTGHATGGEAVTHFDPGKVYTLQFRVGAPVPGNLASGDVAIEQIPEQGLKTYWVVTSANVEFLSEKATCKVEKVGGTWRAEFPLLIPDGGPSATQELSVMGPLTAGNLLVTIYAVAENRARDLYREVTVSLAGKPGISSDETCKLPQYTNLRTLHEWTTPPEHIQVTINNGNVDVSTKRFRTELYEFSEPFNPTVASLKGAIENVRTALDRLRDRQESYLNAIDDADMSARIQISPWQPYEKSNGWQPLPDNADAAHKTSFEQVQKSVEWRALATDAYNLFNTCFEQGTRLRTLVEKLLPGSRIDFHWIERGSAWVSHVPWALMYMDPVDVTGQALPDPERFFGFHFRIGSRCWRSNNGSVALGAPDQVHTMNLLYWGRKPTDPVAVEAEWQAREFAASASAKLIPDPASEGRKQQIVLALDQPQPSPVVLIYFYCHCSVGDGAQPCLRFGDTSNLEDRLDRTDMSARTIGDAPLIFANACSTAQTDPDMTNLLEQSFFQRGARAFIGTETKVPIRLASKFAWLYFQFFNRKVDRDPITAGEALTQTRMFLWTQFRNIGGLFYSMSNQYDLYLASNQEVLELR